MAKTDGSPFTGIKLTEQTPLGPRPATDKPIDQRLFENPPSPPAPSAESPRQEIQEVGKEGNREVGREVGKEASSSPPLPFDLNEPPYRKDSYLFTDVEWEAIEDLKIQLRRRLGKRVTKNDVARCAMAFLISDYQRRKDDSAAVRMIKKKQL